MAVDIVWFNRKNEMGGFENLLNDCLLYTIDA